MVSLELQLLGIPKVALDGEPVQLDRRASLALLAYLALTHRAHSRDELATLLSGDATVDSARKRLRNALADLVEHGLAPFLSISRQSIAFQQASDDTLDTDRLDAIISPDRVAPSDAHEWAAERCDWELLAGLSLQDAPDFEIWLAGEREHRRHQLTIITEQYLDRLTWSGQQQRGIPLARRLLAVEPWRESTHRALMRLLARDGQTGAALAQFERCREALAEELGEEPDAETVQLADRLRAGPVTIRENLPTPVESASLIGRDTAVDLVARTIVDPSCRLLSLVGLGGLGKTSLAVAAAARVAAPTWAIGEHPFADGVWFVDLRESNDSPTAPAGGTAEQRLLATAALALGIAFYGRINPLEQVVAYLQTKQLLLVLDNMETVADGVAPLSEILRRAPGVTILTTARSPLGLPEEWVIEPPPLKIPAEPADVSNAPASQLLLRDARRAGAHISDDDWPDVVRICRLTGGLPLALKIAASALGTLTCAEVATELAEGATLYSEPALVDGGRVSMRSVVAAAVERLPAAERHLLPLLAVFPASFDRAAAAAIGASFSDLLTLCRRSLVERDADGRYSLHPLVRRAAIEQLAEQPRIEHQARSNHAAHFAGIVAELAPELYRSAAAQQRITGELANIRAAWDWNVGTGDIERLQQLFEGLDVWSQRAGQHDEWTRSIEAAVARLRELDEPVPSSFIARLLTAAADALLWQGEVDLALSHIAEARDFAQRADTLQLEALISVVEGRLLRFRDGEAIAANEALQQARVLARATKQSRIEASSLLALSHATFDYEDYRLSESYLRRAGAVYRTLGDRHSLARTTLQQGRLSEVFGNFTEALTAFEQSLRMGETFGDRFVEAFAHLQLGIVFDIAFGRHREADDHFNRALLISRMTGDPYLDSNIQRGRGRNAMRVGDFERATQSFDYALARARDVGNTRAVGDSLCCLAQLAVATQEHPVAIDRAQQAISLARDADRQHARASAMLALGRALEGVGNPAESVSAYSQALAIAETLGLPYLSCDALTGLASAALTLGNRGLARRCGDYIAHYLMSHQLAGCEEPAWNITTAYRAFDGADDARAAELLRTGAQLIGQRITALPPSEVRRYVDAYAERIFLLRQDGETTGNEAPARLTALPSALANGDISAGGR